MELPCEHCGKLEVFGELTWRSNGKRACRTCRAALDSDGTLRPAVALNPVEWAMVYAALEATPGTGRLRGLIYDMLRQTRKAIAEPVASSLERRE